MAGDGEDWKQPAVISSGRLQAVGGAVKDAFEGATNADGATWVALSPPTVGTVMQWTIKNTGAVALDVGLGESNDDMTLEPGESWSPPFNGAVQLKSNTAAAGAYKAVAVGVA